MMMAINRFMMMITLAIRVTRTSWDVSTLLHMIIVELNCNFHLFVCLLL